MQMPVPKFLALLTHVRDRISPIGSVLKFNQDRQECLSY
jgi:hypothetical protein